MTSNRCVDRIEGAVSDVDVSFPLNWTSFNPQSPSFAKAWNGVTHIDRHGDKTNLGNCRWSLVTMIRQLRRLQRQAA